MLDKVLLMMLAFMCGINQACQTCGLAAAAAAAASLDTCTASVAAFNPVSARNTRLGVVSARHRLLHPTHAVTAPPQTYEAGPLTAALPRRCRILQAADDSAVPAAVRKQQRREPKPLRSQLILDGLRDGITPVQHGTRKAKEAGRPLPNSTAAAAAVAPAATAQPRKRRRRQQQGELVRRGARSWRGFEQHSMGCNCNCVRAHTVAAMHQQCRAAMYQWRGMPCLSTRWWPAALRQPPERLTKMTCCNMTHQNNSGSCWVT